MTAALAPYGKTKNIQIRKSKTAENALNIRVVMGGGEEIVDKVMSAADSIQVLYIFFSSKYFTFYYIFRLFPRVRCRPPRYSLL